MTDAELHSEPQTEPETELQAGRLSERLSERMAAMARDLRQRQGKDAPPYQHVVEAAAASVPGCDGAALSFVRARRAVEPIAATDEQTALRERLQHELGEGPCLDTIWRQQVVHSPDVAQDPRWPTWGPRVAETGAREVLVVRLYVHGDTVGALSLYSTTGGAFDDEAREESIALAAHVAVAVAADQQVAHLILGLDSRAVVGQATGILMERFGLDAGGAFAVLTRLSSTENVKLRVLAADIIAGRVVGGA